MNKIKIAYLILLFDPVPYVEKKFKNHAISPRITHVLLLTGFGDFSTGFMATWPSLPPPKRMSKCQNKIVLIKSEV